MNDAETYELIERYLAGELDRKTKAELEQRMRDEPEFRSEVELHAGLQAAIGDEKALEFAKTLAEADRNYFASSAEGSTSGDSGDKPAKSRPLWAQRYSVAAAILLLALVGGYFLIRGPEGAQTDAIYDSYFAPYEAAATFRSEDSVLNSAYRQAFDAYNGKNFAAAYDRFNEIERKDSTELTASFYLAISSMAKGDHDPAISRLQTLAELPQHTYSIQSRWYLAMAYLHKGKVGDSRKLLDRLVLGKGKYAKLADEVLAKL